VRRTPRSVKVLALLLGLGMFAAACGDDSGSSSNTTGGGAGTTASGGSAGTTAAAADRTPTGGTITIGAEQWPECINPITQCNNSSWEVWTTQSPTMTGPWVTTNDGNYAVTALLAEEPTLDNKGITSDPFTITFKINPDAVWDDGSPITSADFDFTWHAIMDTEGSISTAGYDQIDSIDSTDPATAVVKFKANYAAYKNLFYPLLKKAAFTTTNLKDEMQDNIPFSGGPFKIQSWSPEQLVLVPNTNYWDKTQTPLVDKVVMVPFQDTDTELNALLSGQVDMIFPQPAAGTTERLSDPNIKFTIGYGTNYENLWIQQKKGPFSDPILRQAFVQSVDTQKIIDTIYKPINPDAKQNVCMVWVPTVGQWCDQSLNQNLFNPDAAAKLLTDNGWAKGSDGIWAKGSERASFKWTINTGNTRRENTQALVIPQMKALGFELVPDNTDAATYFQQKLPALDTELAMYIQTATPDPTVTTIMSCDYIPTPENPSGQNDSGWCNPDASKLMAASDAELDQTKRVDEIHQIGKFMADDYVMVPLFQFPNLAAWRTDRLDGPIDADVSNYLSAFVNLYDWKVKS
jgi:peptide/nickel transport system substrate-binding protein